MLKIPSWYYEGKEMVKAQTLEKELQELVDRCDKLHRIRRLRQSEFLKDLANWIHSVVKEQEIIKKRQADFETQLMCLRMRLSLLGSGKVTEEKVMK